MAVTTRKTPIKYRRGKPIPRLMHGDVIDWTTFPLGSKPNGVRIELCPKCGRKGEASHYKPRPHNGVAKAHSSYNHTSEFQTMFWFVRDHCTVMDEA